MRFMILLEDDRDTEAGVMPDEALIAAMTRYNEELVKAGVLRAGEGLQPTSKGARVQFSGEAQRAEKAVRRAAESDRRLLDLRDALAGRGELEWVKRCPDRHRGDAEIEIRQIFEFEDFGDARAGDPRGEEPVREENERSR
jgi:hypothetical protein